MNTNSLSVNTHKRPYNNAWREEQAQQTRERIAEAVIEVLRDAGLEELSVAEVAERAGVSPATVYRHFPDREALIDGADAWLGEKFGRPGMPSSLEELAQGAPEVFRYYAAHEEDMWVAKRIPALQTVRARAQPARDRQIEEVLEPLTDHLEPDRARAVHGVFRCLFGYDAYELLRDRFGADAEMASEAVGWAARALIRELERERGSE